MSAAKRVAEAAKTIRARWEKGVSSDPQTEAAQALEDTGQLLDPEAAAELVAFRKVRELAEQVAEHGPFPVPVGPVLRSELDQAHDGIAGACLARWESEQENERLRWALASARRGRSRLRAQVAELESAAYGDATVRLLAPVEQIRHLHACVAAQLSRADTLDRLCREQRARADALELERHSTNEARDDVVQELRARPSCPCPPVDQPGPHQIGCPQAEVPPVAAPLKGRARLVASAVADAEATHWKRLGIEDPHDGPLAHTYRVGHDLPEAGGV